MKTFNVILCSGLLVLSSLQAILSQDAAEATTAAAEETTVLSASTSASLSAVTTDIAQDATTVSPAGTTLANSDTTLAAVVTTAAVIAAETTVLAEGTTVAETTAVADVATTAATVAETTAAVAEVTTVVADTTATDGADVAATTVLAVVETTAAAVIETTVATTMADTAETTGAAETTVLSTGTDDATTIAAGTTELFVSIPADPTTAASVSGASTLPSRSTSKMVALSTSDSDTSADFTIMAAKTAVFTASTMADVASSASVSLSASTMADITTSAPAPFTASTGADIATEVKAASTLIASTANSLPTDSDSHVTTLASENGATQTAGATTAASGAVTTQAAEAGAAVTTAPADGNAPTTAAAGITPAPVGGTTLAGAAGATTIQDTAGSGAGAVTTAGAPQGTTQPADPCTPGGYKLISEGNRHFSSETAPSCDRSLQEGWYRFMVDGKNAQITDQCIKEGSCGSRYPMRIDLGGRAMPKEGSELKVEACTVGKGPFGSTECCLARVDVVVKGCSGFHVYKLQPTPHCEAIYCVQYVDEVLPRSHQAIPPPPVNRELKELSSEERANAVTFEVDLNGKPFDQDKFSEDFKEILIAVLNNPDPPATTLAAATTVPATVAAGETATTAGAEPAGAEPAGAEPAGAEPARGTTAAVAAEVTTSVAAAVAETTAAAAAGGKLRRKKRSAKYGTDDVIYVAPTPHVLPDGKIEVVLFVKSSVNGKPVVFSQEELLKHQEQIQRELDAKMGVKVIKVSAGVPPYILDAEASESRGGESNIFMDHLGLFVTMIVVACVCIIVIIIGLILLKKCHNGEYYIRPSVHDKDTLKMEEGKKGKKQPMESPLTDEEIMKDEKPMLETTPSINGHGKNMNKHDDDGWVVPYEELTKDQRDQPEVEDTKL